MNKQTLINKIKENAHHLDYLLDASRYENDYGGYADSREWFMKFLDKEIDIDTYLTNISEEKLKLIASNL